MSQQTVMCGGGATAQYVADQLSESNRLLHRSNAFGIRNVLREELAEVWEECRKSNWDGYDALPVTQDALRSTYVLLESLPLGFPRPSVAADPHGHFSLEWYNRRRRVLSLGITPDDTVHYAAILGLKRVFGSEPFFGEVPESIIDLVCQVYS